MDFSPVFWVYQILQWILDKIFSPTPPPPHPHLRRPKIAIIGAGLTGVSAASHCVGHGFDVTIFEAEGREKLGGIWSVYQIFPANSGKSASGFCQRVNTTSGLQIHSVMYRFHPSVKWTGGYPKRNQIVDQITKLWTRYGLDERTKFDTRVTSISKDKQGRWIINNPSHGRFDGVIAAVGTCGDPKLAHLPGQEDFQGEIFHSSKLNEKVAEGKKVLIIGGGASAVEALEWAVQTKAAEIKVLSRSDKWIVRLP